MNEATALEVIRTALSSYIENCSGVRTPETKEIEKAWKVISKGAEAPKPPVQVKRVKCTSDLMVIPSADTKRKVKNLGKLICYDEDRYANIGQALKLLEAQAEVDGTVMADNIVLMWQKVESSFTVDELLSEIEN